VEEVNSVEKYEDVVAALQDRVAKLLDENNTILKEKNKAIDQKNKIMVEKTEAVTEKTRLKKQMENMRKFVVELQGAVECPVCLVVPREGPVPCCPAGHITCSPCLERWRGEGNEECPTCRLPMGEGKSLLARVVIEHMEHECSLEGCQAMVAHEGYKEHQEACTYRLVICPGSGLTCTNMLPFCQVEEHVKTCEDFPSITVKTNKGTHDYFSEVYTLEETALQESELIDWGSKALKSESGKLFFFRMNKVKKIFSVDVVMMGRQEECDNVQVEIGFMNPETEKVFFKSTFNPRPITTTNSEELCLTVKQALISKYWHYNQTEKSYDFDVSIEILPEEEEVEEVEEVEPPKYTPEIKQAKEETLD